MLFIYYTFCNFRQGTMQTYNIGFLKQSFQFHVPTSIRFQRKILTSIIRQNVQTKSLRYFCRSLTYASKTYNPHRFSGKLNKWRVPKAKVQRPCPFTILYSLAMIANMMA